MKSLKIYGGYISFNPLKTIPEFTQARFYGKYVL